MTHAEEMNLRNLGHLLRAFELKDLGRVLAKSLAEQYGHNRAETVLLDGMESFRNRAGNEGDDE